VRAARARAGDGAEERGQNGDERDQTSHAAVPPWSMDRQF
jgi:hypothetical protein